MEKRHIERTLSVFEGNMSRTAKALGIVHNTLKAKIEKYRIEV